MLQFQLYYQSSETTEALNEQERDKDKAIKQEDGKRIILREGLSSSLHSHALSPHWHEEATNSQNPTTADALSEGRSVQACASVVKDFPERIVIMTMDSNAVRAQGISRAVWLGNAIDLSRGCVQSVSGVVVGEGMSVVTKGFSVLDHSASRVGRDGFSVTDDYARVRSASGADGGNSRPNDVTAESVGVKSLNDVVAGSVHDIKMNSSCVRVQSASSSGGWCANALNVNSSGVGVQSAGRVGVGGVNFTGTINGSVRMQGVGEDAVAGQNAVDMKSRCVRVVMQGEGAVQMQAATSDAHSISPKLQMPDSVDSSNQNQDHESLFSRNITRVQEHSSNEQDQVQAQRSDLILEELGLCCVQSRASMGMSALQELKGDGVQSETDRDVTVGHGLDTDVVQSEMDTSMTSGNERLPFPVQSSKPMGMNVGRYTGMTQDIQIHGRHADVFQHRSGHHDSEAACSLSSPKNARVDAYPYATHLHASAHMRASVVTSSHIMSLSDLIGTITNRAVVHHSASKMVTQLSVSQTQGGQESGTPLGATGSQKRSAESEREGHNVGEPLAHGAEVCYSKQAIKDLYPSMVTDHASLDPKLFIDLKIPRSVEAHKSDAPSVSGGHTPGVEMEFLIESGGPASIAAVWSESSLLAGSFLSHMDAMSLSKGNLASTPEGRSPGRKGSAMEMVKIATQKWKMYQAGGLRKVGRLTKAKDFPDAEDKRDGEACSAEILSFALHDLVSRHTAVPHSS